MAIIAVVIGGGYQLHRSHDDDPGSGKPASTPTPSLTPTALPTVTLSPTPTAPPTTRAPKPLPTVKPSAPKRVIVAGLFDVGFDSVVAPHNGVFRAASTAEVARWGGRGVPGSPSPDTVYVIGKVSTRGAFAKLPKLHRGVRISLQTRTGVLTYTVQTVTERKEQGLTADPTFREAHPGRLQLVGIRYGANGDRMGMILVVTAQLTGAHRNG
jgi:hypothetical protein